MTRQAQIKSLNETAIKPHVRIPCLGALLPGRELTAGSSTAGSLGIRCARSQPNLAICRSVSPTPPTCWVMSCRAAPAAVARYGGSEAEKT